MMEIVLKLEVEQQTNYWAIPPKLFSNTINHVVVTMIDLVVNWGSQNLILIAR